MDPRATVVSIAVLLAGCQAPTPEREALHSQLPERPYSSVVRSGDTYYFAGKVGVTEETRALDAGRTAAEARNIMESYRALLEELDLDFADVVQGSVFLTDVDDYETMNSVYGEYFPQDPPARTTVAVSALPGDARVEIALIAVRSRQRAGR